MLSAGQGVAGQNRTGAVAVTEVTAVVAVETVAVLTIDVTAVVAVVCGVVCVFSVTVVVGRVVFAVVVVTPEVVAEGLGVLVCPVEFTVTSPEEVAGDGRVVLEVVLVPAVTKVVVALAAVVVAGVRAVLGEGEVKVDMVEFRVGVESG